MTQKEFFDEMAWCIYHCMADCIYCNIGCSPYRK